MVWLIIRLLPYAMMAFGPVLALAGIVVLADNRETAATSVTIAALESSGKPGKSWIRVTEGALYWPESLEYYREEAKPRSPESRKLLCHFVPLVSKETAMEWSRLSEGAKRPDVANLVYVRFMPNDFLRQFPDAARGVPKSPVQPFVADGTFQSTALWPSTFKDYIQSSLGMQTGQVLVVDAGDKPLQKGEAGVLVAIGLGTSVLGVVWVVMRFRSAARRRAIANGIDVGVR